MLSPVSVRPGAETKIPHRHEPVLLLLETRNFFVIATTPLTWTGTFGPTLPVAMSWIVTSCAAPPVPLLLLLLLLLVVPPAVPLLLLAEPPLPLLDEELVPAPPPVVSL